MSLASPSFKYRIPSNFSTVSDFGCSSHSTLKGKLFFCEIPHSAILTPLHLFRAWRYFQSSLLITTTWHVCFLFPQPNWYKIRGEFTPKKCDFKLFRFEPLGVHNSLSPTVVKSKVVKWVETHFKKVKK